MTSRQARKERRAAERKAKKLALKAAKACPPPEARENLIPSPEQSDGSALQSIPTPERSIDGSPDSYSEQLDFTNHLAQPRQSLATASRTRAEINRANAQNSTGPRSSTGKLASSRNSLKHGLASGQLLIPGEDPADFEALLTALLDEHQPEGQTEELLVHQMAQSHWLTQRALCFQNQCFTAEGVDEKRLSLFLRYQTTHERAFHKALNTLIQLKKNRARGFVSQGSTKATPERGFVSQRTVSQAYSNESGATIQSNAVSKTSASEIPDIPETFCNTQRIGKAA